MRRRCARLRAVAKAVLVSVIMADVRTLEHIVLLFVVLVAGYILTVDGVAIMFSEKRWELKRAKVAGDSAVVVSAAVEVVWATVEVMDINVGVMTAVGVLARKAGLVGSAVVVTKCVLRREAR